jgi:hypothetical protein
LAGTVAALAMLLQNGGYVFIERDLRVAHSNDKE